MIHLFAYAFFFGVGLAVGNTWARKLNQLDEEYWKKLFRERGEM